MTFMCIVFVTCTDNARKGCFRCPNKVFSARTFLYPKNVMSMPGLFGKNGVPGSPHRRSPRAPRDSERSVNVLLSRWSAPPRAVESFPRGTELRI